MPLQKSKTGIEGLDELTGGGLPSGRSTLLCGGPGCGKTLMSMTFLNHGAIHCDEPGVFVAFEESPEDLNSGERNRGLYILKSRGMAHSNQIREFSLTRQGVDCANPTSDPPGAGGQDLGAESRLRRPGRRRAHGHRGGRGQEIDGIDRDDVRERLEGNLPLFMRLLGSL